MNTKTILIKKYENRRLYDATNSRYINLDEVAQFVKQGHDVRVVDVTSGDDITRGILIQIIAEGAKTPDSGFPLDILRQMVIASGRASQESALRYTKAMLDLYQSTYRAMAPALNPFEFIPNSGEASTRTDDEASRQATADSGSESTDFGEMNRLKGRVAELEKLVSSLASGRTRAKKPSLKLPRRKSKKSKP